MASYSLCHDAIISFAELSLSLLFLFFFFCFSTPNCLVLRGHPGAVGWQGSSVGLAGTQHSPCVLPTHSGDTAVLPQPLSLAGAAAPAVPQLCPRCAPVPSLPGGDPVVAQGWPRGSLPHAPCRGLSVSKDSRFKSAFLPRPAPATRLRYPCEWRRKTKNKNSAKSLTNASAFKH